MLPYSFTKKNKKKIKIDEIKKDNKIWEHGKIHENNEDLVNQTIIKQ